MFLFGQGIRPIIELNMIYPYLKEIVEEMQGDKGISFTFLQSKSEHIITDLIK